MAKLNKIIQRQTIWGDKVTMGDVTLTPQSQALVLRWRFGGWVWNRPVALLMERGEQVKRIPIVDVTRVVQVGLLGLSLAFSTLIFLRAIRQRRNQNE